MNIFSPLVMPKQWIYVQDVDVLILSFREAGTLDNLRTKWFANQICPDVDNTPTAMDIASLAGLFLTFAVIGILSILLFMWRTRCTIIDYLLDVAHRNNLLTRVQMSMIRRGTKSS